MTVMVITTPAAQWVAGQAWLGLGIVFLVAFLAAPMLVRRRPAPVDPKLAVLEQMLATGEIDDEEHARARLAILTSA